MFFFNLSIKQNFLLKFFSTHRVYFRKLMNSTSSYFTPKWREIIMFWVNNGKLDFISQIFYQLGLE